MKRTRTLIFATIHLVLSCALSGAGRTDHLGDPLPDGAVQRLGTQRMRCWLTDVVYSGDGGKALAIVGKELHVWDLARGEQVGRYPVSKGKTSLRTLVLSPDGRFAIIGDSDGTIFEWDMQKHEVVRQFATGRKKLTSPCCSPDGERVLTLDLATSTVEEWDRATGKRRLAIEATESKFACCIYGPDGTTAFVGSQDQAHGPPRHEIYHYDLTTGKLLKALRKSTVVGVYDMDLSPDGKRLLTRLRYANTIEWRLSDYKLLHHGFRALGRPGPSAAYARDERFLLTGSRDGTVRLWNRATGEVVRKWAPHSGWVRKICVSPDGQWVLSYGSGRLITETNIETGRPRLPWDRHLGTVFALAFSPDGSRLASGSADRTIRVWSTEGWKCLQTIPDPGGMVRSVAMSPDGQRVLAGSRDGAIREFIVATGEVARLLRGHFGHVHAVAYLEGTRRVLSAADDGTVRLWDLDKGRPIHIMQGHLGGVLALAVSPDNKRAISGGRDGTVREWDLTDGRLLRSTLAHRGWIEAVDYSPDGRHAISAGREGTVIEWGLPGWRPVRTLSHGSYIHAARYVPNGKQICSAGRDRKVMVWDRATGKNVKTFSGHGGTVYAIATSPDSSCLLSGSEDNTILVWELPDHPGK